LPISIHIDTALELIYHLKVHFSQFFPSKHGADVNTSDHPESPVSVTYILCPL